MGRARTNEAVLQEALVPTRVIVERPRREHSALDPLATKDEGKSCGGAGEEESITSGGSR